jgi:hypothetical protein
VYNISVISCLSVLLLEESQVPPRNLLTCYELLTNLMPVENHLMQLLCTILQLVNKCPPCPKLHGWSTHQYCLTYMYYNYWIINHITLIYSTVWILLNQPNHEKATFSKHKITELLDCEKIFKINMKHINKRCDLDLQGMGTHILSKKKMSFFSDWQQYDRLVYIAVLIWKNTPSPFLKTKKDY